MNVLAHSNASWIKILSWALLCFVVEPDPLVRVCPSDHHVLMFSSEDMFERFEIKKFVMTTVVSFFVSIFDPRQNHNII